MGSRGTGNRKKHSGPSWVPWDKKPKANSRWITLTTTILYPVEKAMINEPRRTLESCIIIVVKKVDSLMGQEGTESL